MKRFTREEIKDRFRAANAKHEPIVICAAGLGLFAYFEERGGADMIAVYHSAYLRTQGFHTIDSSFFMHVGDTNGLNLELGRRMSNVIDHTPVLVGVLCNDFTRNMGAYFDELCNIGYSAVMNFPTIGWARYCETRQLSESMGVGLAAEIKGINLAADRGLFTFAVAFSPQDAAVLAAGKIDAVIYHLGMLEREIAMPLDKAAAQVREATEAARAVKPDVLIFVAGGPLVTPKATEFIYANTKAIGFFAEDIMDTKLVVEPMTEIVRHFKSKSLR